MTTQIIRGPDTLRVHRNPAQWRRLGPKVVRALNSLRTEAMEDLPKPHWRPAESGNVLDLTLSHIVLREVLSLEKRAEIDDFVAANSSRKNVASLKSREVSIFDRNDYARALSVPGTYTNTIEDYLNDFVAGYSDGHVLRTFINRAIIVGAHPNRPGSRYIALSLEGEGAGQVIDERASLRSGIPGYPGRIISVPHFSILETKDQQMAVELRDELGELGLNGSEVLLGRPEVYRTRDIL